MNKKQSFYIHRYLIQSIDPVHIGTGGMRLGRVDNSIVREPGTKLPKIPGTSLSGAIRSYAAYRYGKRDCAGQKGHCSNATCPICYTFGSISGEGNAQKSYAGVVSIGDARILLFPVYSMAGPIWVTSPSTLNDFGITGQSVSADGAKMSSGLVEHLNLNLGWLMVEKEGILKLNGLSSNLPTSITDRIVLISDKLFSHVVNSNLEVRTSVSINPKTGAAEEGALFTYEAIPRATFLWLDVVVDDYRDAFPAFNELEKWKQTLTTAKENSEESFKILQMNGLMRNYKYLPKDISKEYTTDYLQNKNKLLQWIQDEKPYYQNTTLPDNNRWKNPKTTDGTKDTPADVIAAGLEWTEHLGIGGMGTRGFGRIRKVAAGIANTDNTISWNPSSTSDCTDSSIGGEMNVE
jgi:CRISPR-associated protein Cmr4